MSPHCHFDGQRRIDGSTGDSDVNQFARTGWISITCKTPKLSGPMIGRRRGRASYTPDLHLPQPLTLRSRDGAERRFGAPYESAFVAALDTVIRLWLVVTERLRGTGRSGWLSGKPDAGI
jgi:hypothetical protein